LKKDYKKPLLLRYKGLYSNTIKEYMLCH
jgi:hypothetical protein